MAIFDGNLKQRLIGAIVIIVLAVVFLPMIFNNKGEKLPETVVNTPAEPTKPETPATQQPTPDIVADNTQQATTPIQPDQTNQPVADNNTTNTNTVDTTTATSTPAVTTTQPEQPTTPTQTVDNTSKPSTTTTKPVVSTPNAKGITPTWTIQIAAVSNVKNAEEFTNKLRKANYNAYTRTEGNIHRVFVGPFIEKAEATRVQALVEKQFKEKGIVREFKPERQ